MSESTSTATASDPASLKGFTWWRRKITYQTGLGLTPEAKLQFETDLTIKTREEDCARCYTYRDQMMQTSPIVRFMLENAQKVGANISDANIVCDYCPELMGGGFHPELGIVLCQNRILSKTHLEDTLTHELVHAFDHNKFNVDWLDLRHHACSEIRASTLSGECRLWNEIKKTGFGGFGRKFQTCVKRRAAISVAANPNCKDKEQAERVVDEVFESCFKDTRPFDEVYK
ncbi:hypothetical protein BABINDRAFT_10907 [Babjeviella inositovora NRRL Y-12698]|uniref:Mitochondrial inner membrane protease ATP23 n=1 Tax=Babjeviella inositovora NRRL Y-12698 TaxID=984486 RepID=A0A1E3QZH5_9ASCO|nr:uncharacterized protein BABINDRAFT_10907 [Babjeviella inositovora NRRL Y-12698]ODQ82482.1 hypothetical protein BABINDRAFT_10907 [Babjeviella inositovora NRRL Y-12698]